MVIGKVGDDSDQPDHEPRNTGAQKSYPDREREDGKHTNRVVKSPSSSRLGLPER